MQNTRCAIDIGVTPLCVVRDSVIVQVPLYMRLGSLEHLAFAQLGPHATRPLREFAQTAPELLTAGSAFDLEVSLLGLSAVMGEAQEGKLLLSCAALFWTGIPLTMGRVGGRRCCGYDGRASH